MSYTGILEIDLTRPQYSCGRVKINNAEEIIIEGYEHLKPAFDGDHVKIAIEPMEANLGSLRGRVVEIIARSKTHRLSGILYLNSRVIYGANKRGVPYFLFKPSDPAYPNCIVASGLKLQMREQVENQYIVVDFDFTQDFWNSKFPKAKLIKCLGRIGDLEVEYQQILYRWRLDKPSFHKLLKEDTVKRQIDEDLDKSSVTSILHVVEDLTDKIVFSIDPEGCQDIDDALHVVDYGNLIEVGVHIADVSWWIRENSILDMEARSRMTTIYPPNGRIDMLPEVYATKICSLVENTERLALSTILIFTPKGELRKDRIRFVHSRIKSRAALSYEAAEILLTGSNKIGQHSADQSTLKESLETLAYISKDRDTHKIVEYFMVLVNQIVAEKLSEVCPEKLILRVHRGQKAETVKIYEKEIREKEIHLDSKLLEHLRIVSMNSAEYVPALISDAEILHYGLGLKYYTHFTSPIRRYVDLINHRLVKRYLIGEGNDEIDNNMICNLEEFCSRLNDLQNRNNIAERQFKLLKLVAELETKWINMEEIITHGYITDLSEAPFITIYIPEFDLSKRHRIFHTKLDTLMEINNKMPDYLEIRNRELEQVGIELRLLQKLQLKIVPNMQGETFAKKIKIEFLDECFSGFF